MNLKIMYVKSLGIIVGLWKFRRNFFWNHWNSWHGTL